MGVCRCAGLVARKRHRPVLPLHPGESTTPFPRVNLRVKRLEAALSWPQSQRVLHAIASCTRCLPSTKVTLVKWVVRPAIGAAFAFLGVALRGRQVLNVRAQPRGPALLAVQARCAFIASRSNMPLCAFRHVCVAHALLPSCCSSSSFVAPIDFHENSLLSDEPHAHSIRCCYPSSSELVSQATRPTRSPPCARCAPRARPRWASASSSSLSSSEVRVLSVRSLVCALSNLSWLPLRLLSVDAER